jgi:hypothetical protein
MKKLIQVSLLFLFASVACAQDDQETLIRNRLQEAHDSELAAQEAPAPKEKVLRVYDWKDWAGQIPNSQIVSMDGMSVLKIENTTSNTLLEITLLKITNSSIIKKSQELSCDIKCENVAMGYKLQTNFVIVMDRFPNSSDPTWKTNMNISVRDVKKSCLRLLQRIPPLAVGGDETTNSGEFDFKHTSNWKPYTFAVEEGSPSSLELQISLQSVGTIYLRPIKLLGTAESSNWWSPQQIGLIGGIGGSIIGFFGGLLGLLASIGKARNFVLATMKIFIALGILLTIAGFVAVVSSQPYAVWYALLLPGVILTLVFSLTLPSIQRRYDELEIRRMTSVDAMGS